MAKKRKNKAAQELAKGRSKLYGKGWEKENAQRMVAGRKAKSKVGTK
jgi:hypothetical protein